MAAPGTAGYDNRRAQRARRAGQRGMEAYALAQGLESLFEGASGFMEQQKEQRRAEDVSEFMGKFMGMKREDGSLPFGKAYQAVGKNYGGQTGLDLMGELQGLQQLEYQRAASESLQRARDAQARQAGALADRYAAETEVIKKTGTTSRSGSTKDPETARQERLGKIDKTMLDAESERRYATTNKISDGMMRDYQNLIALETEKGKLNQFDAAKKVELEKMIRAEDLRISNANKRYKAKLVEGFTARLKEARRGSGSPVSERENPWYLKFQGVRHDYDDIGHVSREMVKAYDRNELPEILKELLDDTHIGALIMLRGQVQDEEELQHMVRSDNELALQVTSFLEDYGRNAR